MEGFEVRIEEDQVSRGVEYIFFFQAEDGIRDIGVTGVQTCALPISASPSMIPFLTENAAELKADIALVCDTSMWDRQTPAVTTMLRGLLYEEVFIEEIGRASCRERV